MGRTSQRAWLSLAALIVAMAGVFALRIAAPLGVPTHILYFPLLMVAGLCLTPRPAWILFAVCAGLIAIGAFLAPYRVTEGQVSLVIGSQLAGIPVAAVILWLTQRANRYQTVLGEAHDSVQRSDEQFRQFIEQAPAAVAMFDREMRYVAHSRRWLTQSAGHHDPTHSLVGKLHYSELPNFPEHWKEAHRRALAGETVRCDHDAIVWPDGREEIYRWEIIPWHDHQGDVGGILLYAEPITQPAQIARQLRDSEALYRSLVEHIPRGVFCKDLEGRYTFANQLFCEMLGKPLEAILMTTDDDHFPQELAAKHRCESRQVIETGCEVNVVEEHKAKDKPARYIRIVKTRLVDGDGHVIGTQGIAWDVTELHLEREALRRSEQEFRTLAENLPDIIVRYDRQLRLVYFNKAVEGIAGIPPELFIGKTNTEIDMPDDLVRVRNEKLREAFATGREQTDEFVYADSRGTRYFESHIVPEFALDGTVDKVLYISRDITGRVRAQEQAKLHLAELAHASRLSTIGGLVSEIAHEINQPLHAIVNFTQASINVLEKAPAESRPNLFSWLKQISEQANRAAEIIRRAGRFARKATVRRSTVNINAVVRDCLSLLNFDLRLHRVKLQCELADGLPPLVADPIQIQQLVVNLVRNAVEAMSENAADDRRLIVRTAVADETVQISVCDNGAGLDDETRTRLFEPFFTTKTEGLGLGLAVCQSIVKAHLGRMWAEPNADRGTTFHFTLPLNQEEPQDACCHV